MKDSWTSLVLSFIASGMAIASPFVAENEEDTQHSLFAVLIFTYLSGLCYAFLRSLNRIEDVAVARLCRTNLNGVPYGASIGPWTVFISGFILQTVIASTKYTAEESNIANVIGIVAPLLTDSANLVIETGYTTLAQDNLTRANNEIRTAHPNLLQKDLELDPLKPLRRVIISSWPPTRSEWLRFFRGTLTRDQLNARCRQGTENNPNTYWPKKFDP